MDREEFFSGLEFAISARRLSTYPTSDPLETYGTYAGNIELCESLYPALHCVEVALRNSIHYAAAQEFGDESWFMRQLKPEESAVFRKAEQILKKQNIKLEAENFLPEFSFGFWVNLFARRYEQVLWPKLLPPVFPHMPNSARTRRKVYQRLIEIHTLRNRVFHHEPVWHWPDLPEQHSRILETVGWVSPAMRRFLEAIDRFSQVHSAGAPGYRRQLAAALPGVA